MASADVYRVKPGETVSLAERDTKDRTLFDGGKNAGRKHTAELNERLEALQELLYAEGKQKILVVLQATDTGGKDGTIRHVFDGTNPQGVKVAKFGRPTDEELAHDYLWRVHKQTPGAGEITIFNRSHYEDVLVVRVHNLVPEARWRKRFDHIVHFEQLLADEGTTIVKFFLHISPAEQKERLQERLDNPEKHWKFQKNDIAERARWADYQAAFEDVLNRTSTESAPWYVVPSDSKWYRNLVISQVLVDTLEAKNMTFPEAEEGLEDIVIPDL